MVSLNLVQYREDAKRALLARKNELDQEWDPFVAAWLLFAFVQEGRTQSLPLQELFQRLSSWSRGESAWECKRNLAPLLFLVWTQKHLGHPADGLYIRRAIRALSELIVNSRSNRFSPLRSPEQVFLMALGISVIEDSDLRQRFIEVVNNQLKGPLSRQVILAAALRELGLERSIPRGEPNDAMDVIAALWWAERYGVGTDRSQCWKQFEAVADTLLLNKVTDFDTRRVLSEWEIAILYEALLRQANSPDPSVLFDYYPLHPRVREIAEQDFKQRNYFGAVFEACKVLEDHLRTISGTTKTGAALVSHVFGRYDARQNEKTPCPKVKLNPLDENSPDFQSQINEQRGFSALAMGIFLAFRNPKGHQPKDKDWISIDAYEALDQLVAISLVMKRIEKATKSSV